MIEAAIGLIATDGVAGATVDRIAEGARFSRGAISALFGSKDALLVEVVRRVHAQWDELSLFADRPGLDGWIDAVAVPLLTDRWHARFTLTIAQLAIAPQPFLAAPLAAYNKRFVERIEESLLLYQLAASGAQSQRTARIAAALIIGLRFVSEGEFAAGPQGQPLKELNQLLRACLQGAVP